MALPDLHARKAAVLARVGLAATIGRTVKLIKRGREWQGLCPFHSERSPSFTVVEDKGFAHCFGCGWHGGLFDFVMARDGVDFAEALRRLEQEAGAVPATRPDAASPVRRESVKAARPADTVLVSSLEAGVAIWRAGVPARASLVPVYLAARGIDPEASGILDVVRFVPRCPVSLWRKGIDPVDRARIVAPAMVTPICAPVAGGGAGRRFVQVGVHVTFLAADGSGKARLPEWRDRETGEMRSRPSRKIFGEAKGGAVPIPRRAGASDFLDGAWLGDPGPLVVGEGLESTLSLLARVGDARGAVAVLSLDNLQGGWADTGPKTPDGARAMPLHTLRVDPARPAFTLPDAGPVVIGIDADMKGFPPRWVQDRPRGPVEKRALTGAERSTICAALAAGHWRAAGAGPVRVMRPHMGKDFNDEAVEAAAGLARAGLRAERKAA